MDTRVDDPRSAFTAWGTRRCVLTGDECTGLEPGGEPSWQVCAKCPAGAGLASLEDRGRDLFEALSGLRSRAWQLELSNQRLGLLLEILNLVQGAGDLDTTLRVILNCVTSGYSIGFNRAFLFLLDEDGKYLRGTLAVGPATREEAHEIWKEIEQTAHSLADIAAASRLGGRRGDAELTRQVKSIRIDIDKCGSFLAQCLREGEALVRNPSEMPDLGEAAALNLQAFACTPIVAGGKPIGLIVADNFITGQLPGEQQVNLLRALAGQVGQAVTNATRHEDVRRSLQELSTLNEVSKGILATTELEVDLCLIARISAQVLNARGAVLRLVDDETGALTSKAIYGIPISEMGGPSEEGAQAIAEQVLKSGEPALCNEGPASPGEEPAERKRNLICVPLTKGDKVVGALTVFDKVHSEALGDEGFGNDDVRFLTVLAGQAAIAIENAKLFDNLKQSEARIQELHRHLLRSERLAALGELSSQVAHEIRNPLTAIGGFARSMLKRMAPDDRDREYMAIIVSETERLERILTEQLCFAKLSPPVFKVEDINKVLKETTSLLAANLASKKAQVTTDLADDLPGLHIDADKIKQVFINILQNAVESIAEGGRIGISSVRAAGAVEIRVKNDGPPIPREMLDRLFVPFATTKAGGSGLGLAIAYEIVYEHGGTISATSSATGTDGAGTVFLVTLPLTVDGDRRTGPVDRRSSVRDRRRIHRIP